MCKLKAEQLIIAFVTALIGFIKLVQGDAGLMTQACIVFGIVILCSLCVYTYFYWKPSKTLRRVALAGMFAISILTLASFYTWQHLPTKDIIVLLADFEGSSSEQKNYRVTPNIFDRLDETLRKSDDVKIQRLNKVISERKDALNEGEKRKATIVIWGNYGSTDVSFEVLRHRRYTPKIEKTEQTVAVSELKSFKLQTRLSDQILDLSLFTLGLTRYIVNDWDRAIISFNNVLKQIRSPIQELNQSAIYYYRATAYYYKQDYDRAIADFNQALVLNPKNADAYNNRGIVYDEKKDYDRAIADFNQALVLNPKYDEAYNNRGNVYYEKKDYTRAITDYNQSLLINPK